MRERKVIIANCQKIENEHLGLIKHRLTFVYREQTMFIRLRKIVDLKRLTHTVALGEEHSKFQFSLK